MERLFSYNTEIGNITIREDGQSITNIYFGKIDDLEGILVEESALIKKAHTQLEEYFRGERKVFELPLAPKGTEFQKKVWTALTEIPYGETRSYKDIAIAVNSEKAYRAVGMANNKNPLPIVIPCHRVIGSNKKLVGYAGGLDIKTKLLEIEGAAL